MPNRKMAKFSGPLFATSILYEYAHHLCMTMLFAWSFIFHPAGLKNEEPDVTSSEGPNCTNRLILSRLRISTVSNIT